MTLNEADKKIDTKLRAGSRYFLNKNHVPPQAIEIDYSNPDLIIRSGSVEAVLKEVEHIEAGYKYGRLDSRPNLDPDYQQASWVYRTKIEEALAAGYVEVEESEIYAFSILRVREKLFEYHLMKPFWMPVVSKVLKRDWLQSSHYGGSSYFKGQSYPVCKTCHHPLTHLIQLNLNEFPENFSFPVRTGLIKIFYCVDENGDCERLRPKQAPNPRQEASTPNYFCLYVPTEKIEDIVEYPEYDEYSGHLMFTPLQILKWNYGGEEFPCHEYLTEMMDVPFPEFSENEEYAYTFFINPYHSDKLGGWPQSANFDKHAVCKLCSEPMRLFYHLDPNAYVDYSPAAVIGRVFICPKHVEEIFFTYNYY